MGNLDFTNNAGFSAYCVALLVVSIGMLVLSALSAVRRAKLSAVITTAVVGLAAFGYGFYLIFVFQGGTYFVSYYVFVLPVLVTVRLLQARTPGRQKGQQARAKQFKQQVKVGEATYQQQMVASGAVQQTAAAGAVQQSVEDAAPAQAVSGQSVAQSQQ